MNEVDRDLAGAIADPIFKQFQAELVRRMQRDRFFELEIMNKVWLQLSDQTLNLLPKYVSDRPIIPLTISQGESHTALYLCYHGDRPLIANPLFDACLKELARVLQGVTGINWLCVTSDHYGVRAYELDGDDMRCWILRVEE